MVDDNLDFFHSLGGFPGSKATTVGHKRLRALRGPLPHEVADNRFGADIQR